VRLRFAVTKDLSTHQDVVLDIQARLKQAGFEVALEWYDAAAYRAKVDQEGKFDLTLGIWTFDEGSNVYDLFHSRGTKNYFGYSSARMDGLLEQSTKTLDPELFGEIYRRVHREAHADLPYIFLWSVRAFTAVSTKVEGVDVHPYRFFSWIEEWRWK
jgi:peptide/nickel transport system substrate-binding protein